MLLLGERRGGEVGVRGTAGQAERGGGEKCSLDIPRLGNTSESERATDRGCFPVLKSYRKKGLKGGEIIT